ncbi:MAG: hypothetical protein ACM3ML_27255, partial [Micromonosporaceae bacterium]
MADTAPAGPAIHAGPAAAACSAARPALVEVDGFPLALDRLFDPGTHMWVLVTDPGRARIGMDPLGVETSGTLAQLSFVSAGTTLVRGQPFGQLE